ncbi:MAG: response regulator transcription factor [Actinomycetota bacterium]|nr:MAG: putative winged helix family two component transcriptional [Actinomycetota bacterium]MDO8950091.1 response regulator transcription factor [Actinomycetota bacterium]MDP3629631.1 response regulator transcription factor [Actinomycetota bacterium]
MHMKKALLVSDDLHTLAWMREAMTRLDVEVTNVSPGDLRTRLADVSADVVIVDAGRSPEVLSGMVESSAAEGSDIRLLLVIDAEAVDSIRLPVRVPSDFLVRGASTAEFAARARALLWPGEEAATQDVIRIDDLTLNLATYQAHIAGVPVEFTYLEYALFMFLVTHPNRVYSREVLLRRVWGSDYFGGSRTVDVHVRRVRSKLGPELARRFETVRNVGYLWRS